MNAENQLPESPATDAAPPKQELNMVEMAVTFVCPALVTKILLFYFGSMYSMHPGEGYGIALCCTIAFTLIMLSRFVWRYRNYTED